MKPEKEIDKELLSNMELYRSIDMETDWKQVRGKMGFDRKRSLTRIWWAAAVAVLLVGAGFLAQQYDVFTPDLIVAVATGDQNEISLPDGSVVTLNKDAVLQYPERFSRNRRELKLSGEAFFEVEPDPGKPFVVEAGTEAIVEVLGTSFNIKAEKEKRSVKVMVVKGRIAFSISRQQDSRIILEKDQQAILAEGGISRLEKRNNNFLSWKTGILEFDQTGIREVLSDLQSHYKMDIVLQPDVNRDLCFTSIIDNQELESVLDEISLVLGLEYAYVEKQVVISSTE